MSQTAPPLCWVKPSTAPIRLSGMGWTLPLGIYRRLPREAVVPAEVDELAWHTAGVQLAFRSNTSQLRLRVKLAHETRWDHMTKICSSGFDLYLTLAGQSYFVGATRIDSNATTYEVEFFSALPPIYRELTLNFPLYSGVAELEVGIDASAELTPPRPWSDPRPMVIYGSSITQGGCASRPGMCYSNILSRRFNQAVLNLGFSGAGKGEATVITQLSQLQSPRIFILDYEPNAVDGIQATLPRNLDILRQAHPEVPILVISNPRFNSEILAQNSPISRPEIFRDSLKFQSDLVAQRRRAGDDNLYFLSGAWPEYPESWSEFTVDGIHATDAGFLAMAATIERKLTEIFKG